jgi:hypothetical protein
MGRFRVVLVALGLMALVGVVASIGSAGRRPDLATPVGRWYWLGTQAITMGGHPYMHSFSYFDSGPAGQFSLHGKCTALRFFGGMVDDSTHNARAKMNVTGEGGTLDSFNVKFGQVVPRVVNVRGVLRLTFEMSALSGYPDQGWGTVRALCAAQPTPTH